jgi:xanthine dehydrogenase accessory factor
MDHRVVHLLERALAERRAGRAVAACLVVTARGSTPQSAGALMLVDEAAGTWGTIGGGCVEAEVRRRAMELLGRGEASVERFKLDHDYGWDDGLICGGTLSLAIAPMPEATELESILAEVRARHRTSLSLTVQTDTGPARYALDLPPRERLYIAGAGHIGQAVAELAARLDFDATVFDDRHDLLERCREAGAAVVAGDMEQELAAAPIDGGTYCLIVTRGHRHDARALHAVIGRGARYVGMIGSRRKVKLIFDELAERGVPPESLAQVHAPVGLDIGAVSVEEIALSIAAQLVQVHRSTAKAAVDGPLPVRGVGTTEP